MRKQIFVAELKYGQEFYHTVDAAVQLYAWDKVKGNYLQKRINNKKIDTPPYGTLNIDNVVYIEEE